MSMRSWLITLNALVVFSLTPAAHAETYDLQFERMTDSKPSRRSANAVFFGVSTQHFWLDSGGSRAEQFKDVVKKQPEKYACDKPLKGVAELGGKQFAFALDSENLKSKGYHRLYFDFNANGDLTDDKPVESGPAENDGSWSVDRTFFPLHVTLKLDGNTFEYPFAMYSSVHSEDVVEYASASITPAAYRQATIKLDGQSHHIAILDYNSNGRFNDRFNMNSNIRGSGDTVYPEYGDIVVLDGKARKGEYYWDITTSEARHYLSELLAIDGKYYEIKVTPAGDKLTLNPAKLKTGELTNPNDCWRAVIYGKHGLLKVSGSKGQPVPVPEGEWKLLSCCIEAVQTPSTRPQSGAGVQLTRSSAGEAPSGAPKKEPEPTRITARGKSDYKAVKVASGKVAELRFGPPYKPSVETRSRGDSTLELQMSLVGSGGESVSDCQLEGNRPGEPSFAVVTADGDIIERGKFEYG